MSLDEYSNSVVWDSQEDETPQIIFSPYDGFQPREETKLISIWSAKAGKPDEVSPSVTVEKTCEQLPLADVGLGGHRRNLRRRKAIQKLPYSLDRIRHKQLLQGFDISSFDAVSEEIRIPERQGPSEDRGSKSVDDEVDDEVDESQNQPSEDSDVNDSIGGSQSQVDPPTDESESRESSQKQIMFRGKMIDVDRGYRGILPRIAWKKSMKNNKSANNKRTRREQEDRRGLAKRKAISNRQSNQNMKLMDDLIVPDDEIIEVETELVNENALRSARFSDDISELERMSAYYQNKYDDEISSTGSLELYKGYALDQKHTETFDEENQDAGVMDLEHSSEVIEIESGSELSDDYEIAAREDNSRSIEQMLMKNAVSSKGIKKPVRPSKVRYRYNSSGIKRGQTKLPIRPSKKGIRRSPLSNYNSSSASEYKTGSRKINNTESLHRSQEKQEMQLTRKAKILPFGITPKKGSDLSRPVNTFTTVVEGLSRYYAVPAACRRESCNEERIVEQQTSEREHNLASAVSALFSGKVIKIPDVIKVKIADREFVLSKLGGDDVGRQMIGIFDHIIHHGITNTELIEVGELLTAFLLHLNNKGAYEPISKFHRDFRSKVNSLRQNAKPIHFYQIAMCQFMLLEVTKYTSLSSSFKSEIEAEIMSHIVSFFKLFSVCEKYLSSVDPDHLIKAYDILRIVVCILGNEELIWKRLEDETFPPSVAFALIEVFPVRKAHWKILKFENDYHILAQSLDFISYCTTKYEWSLTGDVILAIERILRRRRFEDFHEEKEASDTNGVTYSRGQMPIAPTIFNNYLLLLRSFELKRTFIERIMPMGEISLNDAESVLINRLNLLILLADHSDLNSEKRLGELVYSTIRSNYFASRDAKTLERICQSFLNCLLSLYEIHHYKKIPFKPQVFLLIFDTFIAHNDTTKLVFIQFLERLVKSCNLPSTSSSTFLKAIYPCFSFLCEQQGRLKERLLLLNIYLNNLVALGPAWVHSNLFQAVQKVVEKSDTWMEHYCTIGKFLIENNVIAWWSFFAYNNIRGIPGRLRFYQKVAQLCDSQSFGMIKRSLFETATTFFFQEKSALFAKLIQVLIARETGMHTSFDFGSITDSTFRLLEPFVSVLGKLAYYDLMLKLISEVRESYQKGTIEKTYATRITELFNSQFVDQVKNSHDFLALKRELGISNEETDKSSFRDALKLCPDSTSQACFVESGLIHATVTADEASNYLGKLKSLFVFPVIINPFRFFVSLIDAHLTGTAEDKFLHIKIGIAAYYLRLINDVLRGRFGQVTEEEFLEQCRLHEIICQRLPLSRLSKIPGNRAYSFECLRFQIIILGISQGFAEHSRLCDLSRTFLHGSYKEVESKSSDLSEKINQLVVRTAGQTLHVDFDEPKPDYAKLERLTSSSSRLL